MKRITTTEEFDNDGKLVKRTVVEETDVLDRTPVYIPTTIPEPYRWPWNPVTYHTEITCKAKE